MFKRITCAALSMVLLWGIFVQQVIAAGPEGQPNEVIAAEAEVEFEVEAEAEVDVSATVEEEAVVEEEPAVPGPLSLLVDGSMVPLAAMVYRDDVPYVSVRSAAMALRPDAAIAWTNGCAVITADNLMITIDPTKNYVVANERYLYLAEGVLLADGTIRLPARMIAEIFDASYSEDSAAQIVSLSSGSGAITPGSEFYDKDDLYWLSHIIHAESGNQPLNGKIAVGNVVLNRTANPIFPNTIYGVIYQRGQFTPVTNGTIKLTPNAESVLAAKLCLDGAVVLPTALWFNSVKSKNSWAAKHKSYITTIGGHAFYV